jgi:hypothetical protein
MRIEGISVVGQNDSPSSRLLNWPLFLRLVNLVRFA